MTQHKLKLGSKSEIDLRSVVFFEALAEPDYTRLAEHWQDAGQGSARPSDFKTRIVFVNREPTLAHRA